MKNIKHIAISSVLTAILCIMAPISINIGPVPFTLATYFIMLYSVIFENYISTISIILYILLGAFGLPVFSGYQAGLSKLLSLTGGFIFAYPLMNLFIINTYNKSNSNSYHYIILLISHIILYTIGTTWFCYLSNSSIINGLSICVLPFIITDNIKIILVILSRDKIYKILKKSNII